MDDDIIKSPTRAIRAKCLDCTYGSRKEVELCPARTCPLYAFRFGKNPYRTRTLTDEQKKEAAERLARGRIRKEQEE